MRRLTLILCGCAALLAGCGGERTASPTPNTIEGTVAQATTTAAPAKGDAAAGKTAYDANGCGGCHTYAPAASSGKIGPSLDNLAADATKANQGTLQDYTTKAIVDPAAYVVPGFPNGVMPATYGSSLSQKQIADLVAFLTKS